MHIKQILQSAKSKQEALTTVSGYLDRKAFLHVVSLNPEILVEAAANQPFKDAILNSKCTFLDGVGCEWAYKRLFKKSLKRIGGVDLMCEIVEDLGRLNKKTKILFVGGKGNTAERVAKILQNPAVENIFINEAKLGPELIANIKGLKPNIVFFAFGSPAQEIFINTHSAELGGIVCMGVGGAFDFVAGNVPRAPKFVQNLGLEFLFRLVVQPWRITRQLRLFKFVWQVLTER